MPFRKWCVALAARLHAAPDLACMHLYGRARIQCKILSSPSLDKGPTVWRLSFCFKQFKFEHQKGEGSRKKRMSSCGQLVNYYLYLKLTNFIPQPQKRSNQPGPRQRQCPKPPTSRKCANGSDEIMHGAKKANLADTAVSAWKCLSETALSFSPRSYCEHLLRPSKSS